MTAIDNKTTIESLFRKGETELEFWDLRERAQKADMSVMGLWEMLNAERKANRIELLPNNNIKLVQVVRYKSETRRGVKPANKLCEAIIHDMEACLVAASLEDNIEVWAERLQESIDRNALFFPKCHRPYTTKWDNRKGKYFVNAYASQTAYVRGAAFITISCEVIQED